MNTACPDLATLEKLLLGNLPAADREPLESHLSYCDQCLSKAGSLSADDRLVSALRNRQAVGGGENSDVLAAVIQRAKQLHSEIDTVQSGETGTLNPIRNQPKAAPIRVPMSGPPKKQSDRIDFLRPPQQEDEMGRLGEYRVLDVLGVGGMGIVFRAEDTKLKRTVALKAMKPLVASNPSSKERFVREAQATASITHPHIVHIYQVDEDNGIPFIAMQHLEGESLKTRLTSAKDGRLDQILVAKIGQQVADGLAAAHQCLLIHRDIKPDNIWLEQGSDTAKILDFGLARSLREDDGLTLSGHVVGTPRYMSPEQAKGNPVDGRSDLFSLGSVLYHLLTGKPPFTGGDVTAVLAAVAQTSPEPIAKALPQSDPALVALIEQLLQKDANERPQTADEVSRRLQEIVGRLESGSVPAARPAKKIARAAPVIQAEPQKLARPRRSNQPTLFLGVGVAALLLLGVLGASYFGGLFQVETPQGTLVVKVEGEDFATAVQGKKITIENVKTKEKYVIELLKPEQARKLATGDYQFLLTTDSGLQTRTDRFSITSGETQKVNVIWQPKPDPDKVAVKTPREALPENHNNSPKDPVDSSTDDPSIDPEDTIASTDQPDPRPIISPDSPAIKLAAPELVSSFEHDAENFYDSKFATMSPDASVVAYRMGGDEMHMFDRVSKEEKELPQEMRDALSLDFARGAMAKQVFVTGHEDGNIRLWNFDSLDALGEPFKSPTAQMVHWVALSADGSRLLAMVSDREVKVKHNSEFLVWNTETRKLISRFEADLSELASGRRIDISHDGKLVAVCGMKQIALWDADTGQQVNVPLEIPEDFGFRILLCLSPDGGQLGYAVMNGGASYVAVVDTKTGSEIWRSRHGSHGGRAFAVAFSPDGKLLASTTADGNGRMQLWDAKTGVEVVRWTQDYEETRNRSDSVKFLTWSEDSQLLLSAGFGTPVRVWKMKKR